jgi:hypothetical protein
MNIRKTKKRIKRAILHGKVTGPLRAQLHYPDYSQFFEAYGKRLHLNRQEYYELQNQRSHADMYHQYLTAKNIDGTFVSPFIDRVALRKWIEYLMQFNDDWHVMPPKHKYLPRRSRLHPLRLDRGICDAVLTQ